MSMRARRICDDLALVTSLVEISELKANQVFAKRLHRAAKQGMTLDEVMRRMWKHRSMSDRDLFRGQWLRP